MAAIELTAGTVDYVDAGHGPVVVLLHGLVMDATLWSSVIDILKPDHRCIAPTLPFGAHRNAMPEADLSLTGLASLVGELLDRLDLHEVTLVGNDTGGALVQVLLATGDTSRIARIVLASCDAFDNFPPGLTGETLLLTGRLSPGLFGAFMQQLRLKPMRRLPMTFGWLTKRGDATVRGWLQPVLTLREVRRDTVRMLRALGRDGALLASSSAALAGFDRPALVVWASEDRVMPPADGQRLAGLLPQGQLVLVSDSYTLIPLDRPAELARLIGAFAS